MKKIKGGIHPSDLKRLKKNGNLICIPNDDGVFEEYDDTYDITLHFKTEEEQEKFMEKLKKVMEESDEVIRFCPDNLAKVLEKYGAESLKQEFTTYEHPGLKFFVGVRKNTDENIGYWKQEGTVPDAFAECSKCGYEIYSEKEKTDFCPSCGAEMSGEENE